MSTPFRLKSSPAKGFFSNLRDRVLNLTKKASKVPQAVNNPTADAANAMVQAENTGGAADHTHPEFAELDAALQGGGPNPTAVEAKQASGPFGVAGVMGNVVKNKKDGMWGGIGTATNTNMGGLA